MSARAGKSALSSPLFAVVAVLFSLSILPACSTRDGPEAGGGVSADIRVVDYLGREVLLEKPASRIVALSPHIVENLFSAGLGDRIVAAVNHADFPRAAKAIPRIGGFSHFSREAIVAQQPDLVIGWASGYAGFGRLLEQLDALGIPAYADDPRALEDIARSIGDFATLGGIEAPAALLEAQLHAPLARLRTLRGEIADPVTMFYQIWDEPLQTLGGAHLVNHAIELCGGKNVFADAPVLAPTVSVEAVLDKNPELIVASAASVERPASLDEWQRWPQIVAVANEQLHHVHGDLLSRHTLRTIQGVEALCAIVAQARRSRAAGDKTVVARAAGQQP